MAEFMGQTGIDVYADRQQPYSVWVDGQVWGFTTDPEAANKLFARAQATREAEVTSRARRRWERKEDRLKEDRRTAD